MAGEKTKKIRWSEKAKVEFRDILEFYFERNQSFRYGDALKERVDRKLRRVLAFPESGELIEDQSVRFVIVDNFVLLYDLTDDAIVIQTFRDARRQPED